MQTLIQVVIAYFVQVIASFTAVKTWVSARLTEVNDSIAAETQARTAAIQAETSNRVNQFNSLNSNLSAEMQIRGEQDLALEASISLVDTQLRALVGSNSTSFQSMLNAAINAFKDTSVRDRIIAPFVDGGTIDFQSFSFQPDGKTAIYFVGSVTGEANVTGLPSGMNLPSNFNKVTAGDIYHVTVDDGSITDLVKVEDLSKEKFVELDAALALEAQERVTLAGQVSQQANDLSALKAQFEAATTNLANATTSLFPN